MKKSVMFVAVGLLLSLSGCGTEEAGPAPPVPVVPAAATQPAVGAQPATAAPAAAPGDWNAGQSTGAATELVAGTDPAATYRNTLVDREIGVQVTCPVDRTWRCKLGSDKKFSVADMSSNKFEIRVAQGADVNAALDREIEFVKAAFPGVAPGPKSNGGVLLDVGPDPAWAKPMARKAWIQIKQVGAKLFACHAWGPATGWDNTAADVAQICDSVKAPGA